MPRTGPRHRDAPQASALRISQLCAGAVFCLIACLVSIDVFAAEEREPAAGGIGSGTQIGTGDPKLAGEIPTIPDLISPARTQILVVATDPDIESIEQQIAPLSESQGFLAGRAAYEALVLDAIRSAGGAAPSKLPEVLEWLAKSLRGTGADRVIRDALAARGDRWAAAPEAAGSGGPRLEADRVLAQIALGARGLTDQGLAEARGRLQGLGDMEGEGIVTFSLASRWAATPDGVEQAVGLFDAAAADFDAAQDSWSAALARESCARLAAPDDETFRVGHTARLREAADAYRSTGDVGGQARARQALGGCLAAARHPADAAREFADAETLYRQTAQVKPAAACAKGLAESVIALAERILQESTTDGLGDWLETGSAAARRADSASDLAWIDYERARVLYASGKTEEAETTASSALGVFHDLADDEGYAECAYLLARWASSSGRHDRAATLYREAGLAAAALGEEDSHEVLNLRRAEELRQAGNLEAAGRIATALVHSRDLSSQRRRSAIIVTGDVALLTGRFADAAASYRSAAELADTEDLSVRLGRALIGAGRSVEASALLLPLVQKPSAGRLVEAVYLEARGRSDEQRRAPAEILPGLDRAAGRRGARAVAEGKVEDALAEAGRLAASGKAEDLFDAAAIAAGAGRRELAEGWTKRALAAGLDPILVQIDPALRSAGGH